MVEKRETWSRSTEYLLATAGYAVGLGNVWRFPYLCYRSGGGAFLIPFFIMLALCGIPLLYMEMAVGQFTQQGPIGALAKLCPLLKGAGIATVVISFLFTTYYNVIITWAFFYLFNSFRKVLPWSGCDNDWNSDNCFDGTNKTVTDPLTNITTVVLRQNNSVSPSEDFYEQRVLEKTSGIDDLGVIRWDLTLILLMCWIIVYFCIWKGPKSTGKETIEIKPVFKALVVNEVSFFYIESFIWCRGIKSQLQLDKVVYFTATFPYLVLIILLVRGVTLPGAMNGIKYFVVPRWELLLEANVWVNAAAQTFNSLGIAFGGIITMSSYNKRSNKILKDVLIIGAVDALTCILAGLAIFSILGFIAHDQGQSVEDVIEEGPGLVFIVYPAAFTSMPVSQLFAVLFFFMLVCLGIDSEFASVEVIVCTIQDHFSPQVKRFLKRKEVLVGVVCFVSFLCGLPNVTQGGIYIFQLVDYFAAALSLMYLAFFEVIAITWIYGANRLATDIENMTGDRPPLFFIVCWYCISPVLIFGIWIFSMVQYTPFSVAGYVYPTWALAMGWFIAALSLISIPAGMVHSIYTAKGKTFLQKFINALKPCMPEPSTYPESNETKKFPIDNHSNGDAIVLKDENHLYPHLENDDLPLNGHKYTVNHV